jgi:hypothetical protein
VIAAGTRLARARGVRLGLIVIVALATAGVAANVMAQSARAEAPAQWAPILLPSPSAARVAPTVAIGSAEDRAELDEVFERQSRANRLTEHIAYWTDVPTPIRWNEILLSAVRAAKTNPVRVSRALALLNTAMYDALIAACDAKIANRRASPSERDSRIQALAPPDELSSHASVDAAIAAAAVAVLSAIYPDRTKTFTGRQTELLNVKLATGSHTASDLETGTQLGAAVGALAVARADLDGASAFWQGTIPDQPGAWKPATPYRNEQPTEPLAGTWQPWLLTDGAQLRPGPPTIFDSSEWRAEADEIVRVNDALTDDQVRIARLWADPAGSDTPPGHWLRIALGLATRDHLSLPDTLRLLAHLAMAQADASIASWDAKYSYWSGRPAGLVPGFASTLVTPNDPSYSSGHAAIAGASAVVLAAFFPNDAASLTARGEEAALASLLGGISFRQDIEVGLALGRTVGGLAVERARGDGSVL